MPHPPPLNNLPSPHDEALQAEDAYENDPLQLMQDGEELYFDLNVSYNQFSSQNPHLNLQEPIIMPPLSPSHFTQVSLETAPASPKTAPFTAATIIDEPSQPLLEAPIIDDPSQPLLLMLLH